MPKAKARPAATPTLPENDAAPENQMEIDESPGDGDPEMLENDTSANFSRKDFDPEAYPALEVPPAPDRVATYSADGPRLMITHIDNYFFKSYAGKQSLGPFNKCFTAIVGPNGSGKSNVIDSMLFVFGYRAAKIRSKKISVLIHHSDKHPHVESCSVTVYFQMIQDTGPGDNDYDVIEGSQFNVSRNAFRDNSSFYMVNGKRQTYKEVAVLLRSKGIDLDHNRFLILQGEVEQIAMMKPKAQTEHDEGMLEFLEDIIGSNRYKQPIDTLYKRIEELNEFRAEKLNRVKAVEKEKNNLEGPKNEAMAYLQSENEIFLKQNLLYHKYIQECTLEEDKAAIERDRVESGMTELKEKLAVITKSKDDLRIKFEKCQGEQNKLLNENETLKAKFTEYEKQDIKCREDLKHSSSNTKKIDKNIEQEVKKVENLKKVPEESEEKIQDLQTEQEQHETDKKTHDDKLSEVMDGLKNETKGMQEEKDAKEKDLVGLQKGVDETKSKYEVSKAELDLCLKNQQKETSRLETLKTNFDNSVQNLHKKQEELEKLQTGIKENTDSFKKASTDLKTASETHDSVSKSLHTLRSKVEVAKSSIDSMKSRGRTLDALTQQKRQNKIPGIYGRLGDLGGIDDKYDVAISTACGMLDHIVCDTIDTAQKCVEFLKSSGSGVASFIGLDKMDKWIPYTKKKIVTPENVPRLFDLITVQDNSVLPAFYFALRDTLVAKDLDQATRIAYGATRYRVVTLQGQLIDQSGTMSGGGKSVCKGRMGATAAVTSEYTAEQLQAMESEMEQFVIQCRQAAGDKERLDTLVHQLDKDGVVMKKGMQKCEMDIKALKEQETMLQSQMKEQQEKVKKAAPDEQKVKELQTVVDTQKRDFDAASEKASKVEDVIKVLHKKIMDYGGAKIKPVQTKIDELVKKIDETITQITKLKVGIKTAERNLKKAEDKVISLQKEKVENAENIEKLQNLGKTIEVEAGEVLERTEACEEELQEIATQVNVFKKEQSKLEQEEDVLQKENIDVQHELDKFVNVVKENHLRVKHWKKELSKFKLNKIDKDDSEELPLLSNDDLEGIDKKAVQYEITVQEEKLRTMKPNMAAIEEFRKKEDAYLQKIGELEKITDKRNEQRGLYDDFRKQRLDEFMSGFGVITNKLKEMYRMITLGGDAELELVDSLDPFSEGIVFSVRPRFKSWKNICNLSGGEKTLSSLALVFALHHYKPTPLYVMDEIDAALDFKNVSIVGNYIKDRTKNAQFIIISLRNNMFELADRLVGIYKTFDCTKSVTIDPRRLHIPQQE